MPREQFQDLTWVDLFPNWDLGIEKILSVIAPNERLSSKTLISADRQTRRYQYRVGLVDLDLGLTNLFEIAQNLNSAQSFFHFMCPQMPVLGNVIQNIEGMNHLAIYKIPKAFIAEHRNLNVDLVTCLTRYPLAFEEDDEIVYNYFAGPSDEDERFLFLSADQLYGFCKRAERSFEEGLIHTLVGQLAAYFSNLEYHDEIRGCVMDFCELRSNQVIGLRNRIFCKFCSSQLRDGKLRDGLQSLLSWNY